MPVDLGSVKLDFPVSPNHRATRHNLPDLKLNLEINKMVRTLIERE